MNTVEKNIANDTKNKSDQTEWNRVAKEGVKQKVAILLFEDNSFGIVRKHISGKITGILDIKNIVLSKDVLDIDIISDYAGSTNDEALQAGIGGVYSGNKEICLGE